MASFVEMQLAIVGDTHEARVEVAAQQRKFDRLRNALERRGGGF